MPSSTALVERKGRGASLTVFGQVVAERSQPLLAVEDDVRREIRLLSENQIGSLKVALIGRKRALKARKNRPLLPANPAQTEYNLHLITLGHRNGYPAQGTRRHGLSG